MSKSSIKNCGIFSACPRFNISLAHLEEALAQAETQGLVKEAEIKKGYALQPVFPFFLWQQVLMKAAGPDREGTDALENAFCRYMSILAQSYQSLMLSKESGERQVGLYLFRQDRENLQKALNRVLAGQGDFYALYIVFVYYYHQSTEYREAIASFKGQANFPSIIFPACPRFTVPALHSVQSPHFAFSRI